MSAIEQVLNEFNTLVARGVNRGEAQQYAANQSAMRGDMSYADAKEIIFLAVQS